MEKKETVELDLKRILFLLLNRAWIIVLVGVLVGALAYGYAWFCITPTYSASIKMFVNNNYSNSPAISSSQLAAAQSLAETYMVILKSRDVTAKVAESTGLDYTHQQLCAMIDTSSVNDTEVFQVTVTAADYKHAAAIANGIAEALPEKISQVVIGSSAEVVEYAVENSRQVGPNYTRFMFLGILIGCVASVVLIVVVELLDTSIKSEEYLTATYSDIPLLAVIPGGESTRSGYRKGAYQSAYKKVEKKEEEQA